MISHAIFVNGSATPVVVQPPTHTWRPDRRDVPWEVRVGYEPHRCQGTVIERYTPPRAPARPKPQTPWKGSWAQEQEERRQWPLGYRP